MYRRERTRAENQALSLSIFAGVRIAVLGGDTDDILRPFYTTREWSELEKAREDQRQYVAQQQQLAKLMRLANDRRTKD